MNKDPKSETHECEHFLMTDIAVHECECGSITVSGFGNSKEYLPIEQFNDIALLNDELVKALTECVEYCHDETATRRFKTILETHSKPLNHEQS